MTHFIKSGNVFHVAPSDSLDIREHLPAGVYIVKFDEMKSMYYLEISEKFNDIPCKVYGDTAATAKRILNTYLDRTVSTGVLLVGEKGSGKTMLAKLLSSTAMLEDIPTLIINSAFFGDGFNKFIQDISQRCIVMFDEFEKVYDGEDQEQILTLLDGVFPQKKLFILTCNDEWKLNRNLKNRPGRIFYRLEYAGLDEAFVREYLADNLTDQSQTEQVVRTVTSLFESFNFDMMLAIVQEMNRYNEGIVDPLKFINAKPASSSEVGYTVTLTVKGKAISVSPTTLHVDIWSTDNSRSVYPRRATARPGVPEARCDSADSVNSDVIDYDTELDLVPSAITSIDIKTGVYTYEISGFEITLTRLTKMKQYTYLDALNMAF